MNTAPKSYQVGLRKIEAMNNDQMYRWLRSELFEQHHLLAGQRDDYPVQAIANHFPYLTLPTQKRVSDAIEAHLADQKQKSDWPDAPLCSLLNLTGILRLRRTMPILRALAAKAASLSKPVIGALFGSLAAIVTNDDRAFWNKLPIRCPSLAGLAFRVLARIAPDDTFSLLASLPTHKGVIATVARTLPDLIAGAADGLKAHYYLKAAEALVHLPKETATILTSALAEAGITLPVPARVQSWDQIEASALLTKLNLSFRPSSPIIGYKLQEFAPYPSLAAAA